MTRVDFYLNYELQATFKLESPEVKIGRDPSNAIRLQDETVSRVHAVIRSHNEGHEIENRGANGTKVNGVRIDQPRHLRPGDAIFISRFILIYQSDNVSPADYTTGVHSSTVLP